ncbi:MAG: ankyrin repeat domain-containing protein [Candidatus Nanopelagicales bacterium]
MLVGALGLALVVMVLPGCGTVAFQNRFTVLVDDPAGRLPAGPVTVSVFDPLMGDTRDWAAQFAGPTTPAAPYTRTVSSTGSRMFFDRGPQQDVSVGLAVPTYNDFGYYALTLRPVREGTTEVSAPFVPYDTYTPDEARGPLPVRVDARADGSAWDLTLTPTIPATGPVYGAGTATGAPSADPEATDAGSVTPTTGPSVTVDPSLTPQLIAAAEDGRSDVVRRLLASGAPVDGTDDRGRTALIAAAYENEVATAQVLVQAGADVNIQDDSQQSAFLIATSEVGPDPGLLILTLNYGADVDAKDSFNGTGLIRAADRGYDRIVERLLETDIEVDHVNNLGWTALHEAILLGDGGAGYVRTVQLLVEAGADVNLATADSEPRTPLQIAEEKGYSDIAEILRDAGAIGPN